MRYAPSVPAGRLAALPQAWYNRDESAAMVRPNAVTHGNLSRSVALTERQSRA